MLPVFTGLRLEIDGAKLTLAATDRFRLAVRELEWRPERPDATATALIPARVLAEATRAFAGSPAEVILALSGVGDAGGEGLLGLTGESAGGIRHTTTRLLDGEFPPYRKLFPPEQHTEAYVDTAAIVESLKRVALVAERHTSVQLNFADGQVVLEAGSGDEAQASEALPARIEGDGVATGFNPRYLLDGLSAVRSAVTRLSFTQASRPAVITPAAGEKPVAEAPDAADAGSDNTGASPTSTNGDYRYLIMPVRVPR
jgi:DNA polymerase III subunit beta